jgi:fumarate reductase subunit C
VSPRLETGLWLAQRASAVVLAVAVGVHLATMVYAARGGLSAAEIIARLSDNPAWLLFYLVFVVAVSVHAPIGLRTILNEHTRLGTGGVGALSAIFAVLLLSMGALAVGSLYTLTS